MITHIEIDGFKTFEDFSLELQPFSAVVGPNASGKSNLFDALRFISLLAQSDIRTAMQGLRGEPEELFRRTVDGTADKMRFAIEALLSPEGTDPFGKKYEIKSQRIRYEIELSITHDASGLPRILISHEMCKPISRKAEKSKFFSGAGISYAPPSNPFIETIKDPYAFQIRQDGVGKRGRPMTIPAHEASRSALSTITTAEFPHLFALRTLLSSVRFLEINPKASRRVNDRFERSSSLEADASNLAAVLARIKVDTTTDERPDGVIADISADLASLIPSVHRVEVESDDRTKEYSFGILTSNKMTFSSRVISDGTLRLLALLTALSDPNRGGVLCFEEPENGVHEGRIPSLVGLLRESTTVSGGRPFQVLINTHSPVVMKSLEDDEIIVADTVKKVSIARMSRSVRTRMRTGVRNMLNIDPERDLTRQEVENTLRRPSDAA